jgi:hypothetical protein
MPLPLKPNRWVHSIKVIMPRKEKTFDCEYRKEAIESWHYWVNPWLIT